MKRRFVSVVAIVAAALLVASSSQPAKAALEQLMPGSSFCDGTGLVAIGEGTAAQVSVNADVFRPAFTAVCPNAAVPAYQGTGESNGFEKLAERARDFGASSVALTPQQKAILEQDLRRVQGFSSTIEQFPLYVDIMAIGYNLPCFNGTLRLTSTDLSLIYSGAITTWNDRVLLQHNPGLASCPIPIGRVKRAGDAGSTTIFKDFLSKRNPQWAFYRQPERNQDWPPTAGFACAASDDTGMAQCIASTANSIGYLQYHAAKVNRLRTAAVDNPVSQTSSDPAARFIQPSADACKTAAATVVTTPVVPAVVLPTNGSTLSVVPPPTAGDWSTVSLTDAPAGYPICSFGYWFVFQTWTSAYGGLNAPGKLRTIADYLWIAISPAAQNRLAAYDFAPLPPSIVAADRAGIEALRVY